MRIGLILSILVGLNLVSAAGPAAAATLDVQLGWDGAYRVGRWTPLYITAADSAPRAAVIELYAPQGGRFAMRVRQAVTIGPAPATFILYTPLSNAVDELSVTLRDAHSRRRIAEWTGTDLYRAGGNPARPVVAAGQLIGVSGNDSGFRILRGQLGNQPSDVAVQFVEPLRLPAAGQGYDALNTLLLSSPDLTRLNADQQQAIIDWIRGGGQLIFWSSADPLPPESLLAAALPASIGDNIALDLPPDLVRRAGLAARFARMPGRRLTPLPGATKLELLGGATAGWRCNLGFGQVVLLPFEASTLLFDDVKSANAFWRTVLGDAVVLPDPEPQERGTQTWARQNRYDLDVSERYYAMSMAMDQLGAIPGLGRFGFGYVATVLIGLMVVVGPVDWIVLKKLGRQPWTWVTTAGWAALVTLGAVYLGHLFRSGNLYLHTMRLIDQIDGQACGTIDVAGIYSPRTRSYTLQPDQRESWWTTMSASYYSPRGGMTTDVAFHQDWRGNWPEAMTINVWNLRFLMGETLTAGPAVVEAKLRVERRREKDYVVGTIRNLGEDPLGKIDVEVAAGIAALRGTIEPGKTITVDAPAPTYPLPRPRHSPGSSEKDIPRAATIWNLSGSRTERAEALVKSGGFACIRAEADRAGASPLTLSPAPDVTHHWQFVRAIVPLERSAP